MIETSQPVLLPLNLTKDSLTRWILSLDSLRSLSCWYTSEVPRILSAYASRTC